MYEKVIKVGNSV